MAAKRRNFVRLAEPWHGVSLGGWLLLEPGPSYPLFEKHPLPGTDGEQARCEWDFMEALVGSAGREQAAAVLQRHREQHITKQDFERIRACGMNAVRLPFGYWVVVEPRPGEPYVGPGLEHVDRAVQWAEECGLQIVLDLHGCPGGESGEAPCGRRQRPHGTWHWKNWDFEASLKALAVVVERYRSRACVTGVAVCNEPSNETPAAQLCRYYDRAVDVVRQGGMPASRVAVVLPVFQRDEEKFAKRWQAVSKGRHQNYCFDIHCYHCFENEGNGKSFAQQLRSVEENGPFFQKFPVVVGEWSLSLGAATWSTCGSLAEDEVYTLFGRAQSKVLRGASHGNFFWNWTEHPEAVDWNYQLAHQRGMLSGPAPELPPWDGTGTDPLERKYNTFDGDAAVRYGDKICLRVFYGRYVDVWGPHVCAQWSDKGTWQSLAVCPVNTRRRRGDNVQSGDVVQLRSHNGRFLTVDTTSKQVTAQPNGTSNATKFTMRFSHAKELRHADVIYLESRATRTLLDADDEEDGIFARYSDFGEWQQFVVEKLPKGGLAARPTPKNRESGRASAQPTAEAREAPLAATPPSKRQRLHVKSPSLASISTAADSASRSPSAWSLGPSLLSSSEASVRLQTIVEAA